MSAPPKLYDLAFEIVAKCYAIDLFPIKIPPDSILSDDVFKDVMRIRGYYYDAHTRALLDAFKPRKLELNLKSDKHGIFSEVRTLALMELKIHNFCEVPKYIVRNAGPRQTALTYKIVRRPRIPRDDSSSDDDDDVPPHFSPPPVYFSIAHFLRDILSTESRRQLVVLDISGWEPFGYKWMEVVSQMFPMLEELNISRREFSEEDFQILCNNLTNLNTFRIGHQYLETLDGISQLENLTHLIIDMSYFMDQNAVEDISELKNLRSLCFSHNLNDHWDHKSYFAKPLPELTHLEIKWKNADDHFLQNILPQLPKLQIVVAVDTQIHENAAPPPVTVYTYNNLNAIMNSLRYFRITGTRERILQAITRLDEKYDHWEDRGENGGFCTPDQLTVCVNEVEAILETFKFDKKVMEDVNSFVKDLVGIAMGDGHLNENKLKIVSILLKNLKNHLKIRTCPRDVIFKQIWHGVNRLIQNTEHLNVDKIAALAMESVIYGGGTIYWEKYCVEVLGEILDKMDFSSEYYEKINFRKFHECLSLMYRLARRPENRAVARYVLRYIELFM